MRRPDPLEAAITRAACGVLTRRADALRKRAARLVTVVTDAAGRPVTITAPEARTMLGTAEFLESCAADLTGGAA